MQRRPYQGFGTELCRGLRTTCGLRRRRPVRRPCWLAPLTAEASWPWTGAGRRWAGTSAWRMYDPEGDPAFVRELSWYDVLAARFVHTHPTWEKSLTAAVAVGSCGVH